MKNWFVHNWLYFAGAAVGAVAGYMYWKYVGCVTGTCPISGKPLNSTVYFAAMGSVFFGIFKKENKS